MSYIAAVGAKNKANAFLNNSYSPTDTVGASMSANAAKDVAETENEAQRDYYGRIGEANIDRIKKLGSASSAAAADANIGGWAELAGSAAMGLSKFGQGAGWFNKGGDTNNLFDFDLGRNWTEGYDIPTFSSDSFFTNAFKP